MKTAELFEYRYRKKSEEEKEALRSAPDYWRLQLRKELTKFNQQFGVMLTKAERFNRWEPTIATFGGEYVVLVSGADSLSFSRDQRFDMWKKALAQKLHSLVQSGHDVYIMMALKGAEIKKDESVTDILQRIEHEVKDPTPLLDRFPIRFFFRFFVTKPKT